MTYSVSISACIHTMFLEVRTVTRECRKFAEMQSGEVGFLEGDSGEIELKLRQYLHERNSTDDKLGRQILTFQIRELRDQLIATKPVQADGKYTILLGKEEPGLFDGDIGRIETQLREAMRRKASCTSQAHRDALQREVDGLVELLKSPIIHENANLSIDTRTLWSLIRGQNITGLRVVDPVLLKTLRDPQTGHSALHKAALVGNTDLVDLLIEKGCDVNAICHSGQAPLHVAVQVENIDTAKKLIEYGADTAIADNKDRTPFSGVPQFIVNQIIAPESSEQDPSFSREIDPDELTYGDSIGEGATATVFSGSLGGRGVAIKNFHFMQRSEFNREVRILMRLQHPNLVQLIATTSKDKLRLVMELCSGGSLYCLLHERKFKLCIDQILDACRGTLQGLAYLHNERIIHMDLKSRNILLESVIVDGNSTVRVKIADFGISRIASVTSGRVSAPIIGGTWYWMSPETLVGDLDEISTKSDIYSFAICLFEMLSGELPYAAVEGLNMLPPVTIAIKIANGFRPDVTRISRSEPQVAALLNLIQKSWCYEPSERPTAQSLLDAL